LILLAGQAEAVKEDGSGAAAAGLLSIALPIFTFINAMSVPYPSPLMSPFLFLFMYA
jgi:hypothetical protein